MAFRTRAVAIGILIGAAGFFAYRSFFVKTPERAVEVPPAPPSDSNWYVGSAACAECHPGEALRHSRSGHARTFRSPGEVPELRRLDGAVFQDKERGVSFHYRMTPEGLVVRIPEKFGERPFPLEWALGSGEHAIGFLTLISDAAGQAFGIESRVSVFGSDHHLGLAPSHAGLKVTQPVEEFGRPVSGQTLLGCLNCHVTTAEIVEGGGLRNLRTNVGCEKCHGPGGMHVEGIRAGKADVAIRLGTGTISAAAQLEFCGKCHRHPDRPLATIIDAVNPSMARFQPIGLSHSACYRKSSGKLMCTTCHDPHEHAPRERDSFDGKCVDCHSSRRDDSRRCPISSERSCVECHMPEVEVRPGTRFHDHWIRVRKEAIEAEGGQADGA